MAGSKSDAWEIDVLKMVTGQVSSVVLTTALASVPVKLFTIAPTDSTAGTEVAGGLGYVAVDSKTKWAVPAAGSVSNNAVLTFPTATADWGTIVAFAVCTPGGTEMMWGSLTTQKPVLNGDTPSFAVGQLVLTED